MGSLCGGGSTSRSGSGGGTGKAVPRVARQVSRTIYRQEDDEDDPGTCYAYAAATMIRHVQRRRGDPVSAHPALVRSMVQRQQHGKGAKMMDVLKGELHRHGLRPDALSGQAAAVVMARGEAVLAGVSLTDAENARWRAFYDTNGKNRKLPITRAVLGPEDPSVGVADRKSHAFVITDWGPIVGDRQWVVAKDSHGEEYADGGYIRVDRRCNPKWAFIQIVGDGETTEFEKYQAAKKGAKGGTASKTGTTRGGTRTRTRSAKSTGTTGSKGSARSNGSAKTKGSKGGKRSKAKNNRT